MNNAITPFTINIPQADLDDLQHRLERTRFARELPGVGWSQGIPEDDTRSLVETWKTSFDWRAWEARLNAYPQFTTEIDGQNVYFLHIRSAVDTATPLLLVHGWPGSILEFLDVIEPLTNPVAHGGTEADAFHLVIPSIPGFGFSGPTTESGWNSARIAASFADLMNRLGYDRYGVQGGDFGAFIAPDVAHAAPDHVTGVHINAATYGFIPYQELSEEEISAMSELDQSRLALLQNWNTNGSAYFAIQSTVPQTISYGLADSPVGQLAWIAEKFCIWSVPHSSIDPDLVLAHASLYWLTNTATSSARLYWEQTRTQEWPQYLATPTGVLATAGDAAIRSYGEQGYNIVHWTDLDVGGHFAAMEIPDLFAEDVRTFFGTLGSKSSD